MATHVKGAGPTPEAKTAVPEGTKETKAADAPGVTNASWGDSVSSCCNSCYKTTSAWVFEPVYNTLAWICDKLYITDLYNWVMSFIRGEPAPLTFAEQLEATTAFFAESSNSLPLKAQQLARLYEAYARGDVGMEDADVKAALKGFLTQLGGLLEAYGETAESVQVEGFDALNSEFANRVVEETRFLPTVANAAMQAAFNNTELADPAKILALVDLSAARDIEGDPLKRADNGQADTEGSIEALLYAAFATLSAETQTFIKTVLRINADATAEELQQERNLLNFASVSGDVPAAARLLKAAAIAMDLKTFVPSGEGETIPEDARISVYRAIKEINAALQDGVAPEGNLEPLNEILRSVVARLPEDAITTIAAKAAAIPGGSFENDAEAAQTAFKDGDAALANNADFVSAITAMMASPAAGTAGEGGEGGE